MIDNLNEYQEQFIKDFDGPRVLRACPGSGKTKTMVSQVVHIIETKYKNANRIPIGVFTFSQKAAAECRARIAKAMWHDISKEELEFWENPTGSNKVFGDVWIDSDPVRVFLNDWVCTIHGLCNRLLRMSGEKYKVQESTIELKQLIKDEIKIMRWGISAKSVITWLNRAAMHGVTVKDSTQWFENKLHEIGYYDDVCDKLTRCYSVYVNYMRNEHMIDFNMMIGKTLVKLRYDDGFREKCSKLFDYIIVDEAQDTDDIQFEILRYLCPHNNISVIGDEDQSIYRWRGAVPENIRERFIERYIDVKQNILPVNYRSTPQIVDISSKLIKNNYCGKENFIKPFLTHREDNGNVSYCVTEDENELALRIIEIINSDGNNFSDWFILSRTRAECAFIYNELIKAGIPAQNKSGGLLFGSTYIRKVLAYAYIAINYNGARDNIEMLSEIANVASDEFRSPQTRRKHREGCTAKPWEKCGCEIILSEGEPCHSRFYGRASIEKAGNWRGIVNQQFEKNKGGYLSQAAKGARDLVKFVELLESKANDAYDCIKTIIDKSVIPYMMAEEGLSDDDLAENGRQEEFDVLLGMIEPNMTVEDFINYVEDINSKSGAINGGNSGYVSIGTVHWAKGAESNNVIWNTTRCPIVPPKIDKGVLPTSFPTTDEDERNIAYVAMTRAKNNLYIVASKKWQNKSTRYNVFINEVFESVMC